MNLEGAFHGVSLTSFRGEDDNAKVIQIDTQHDAGRIRVNLNDDALFDGDPEVDSRPGAQLKAAELLLNWRCPVDMYPARQPLTEIAEVGTPICDVCGEDMELQDHVSTRS